MNMNLCAGDDKGGTSTASQARTRFMGYPLPVWFPRAIQGPTMKLASTAAQLAAVLCLVACIAGALAPG